MRVLAAGYPDNGPRLTPPSTRFTTVVGRTYTIALKYSTGKFIQRTGNVMYTLTSGEVAFFKPHVAQAIDSMTLAPGQPFTVCHQGNDNWDIERAIPDAMLPAAAPLPPQQPPQAPPPPPLPGFTGQVISASPAAPLQRVNGQGQTAADLYLQDFQSAIDIVLAGVPLANARGLMVAPSFEDIRCIATHLAISRERQL